MPQQTMSQLRNVALIGLICAFCCLQAIEARTLLTGGDVESETTVHTDPNGGIKPLEERLEKYYKKQDLKYELLAAEAECHKRQAKECPELDEIKAKIEAASPPAEEPAEPTEAPCHQNIIASYFFGTVCDLPPDSKNDGNDKPEPEAEGEAESGRRRLMAWFRR